MKKKRKKKDNRSLLQKWSSERNWEVKGSIRGIVVRLSQIAQYDSTTPNERRELLEALRIVSGVARRLDIHKEASKTLYLFANK